MKYTAILKENVRISIQAIRLSLLRTILTVLIISIGIMALVGILTAIDAIKHSLNKEFSLMGASAFAIDKKDRISHSDDRHVRVMNSPNITYQQAREFKERFNFPAIIALSTPVTPTATLKFKSVKTNPNIDIWGVDENDVITSGKTIAKGRNFTKDDLELNKHTVIIGSDVAKTLFKNKEEPLENIVTIGEGRYKIIGVLKERGSSFGMAWDKICLIPITSSRENFPSLDRSYRINIMPTDSKNLDFGISEAEGLFRIIRGLKPQDENDFGIEKSDAIVDMLLKNTRYVTIAATFIGIITLFGAAIGLMNIMLVSVTERTREIGIRKALGASANVIKQQFLLEAVIIGQMGGFAGIILGILIGNIMSVILKISFTVPWEWIIPGVLLCFIVGIVSGYYPALKAAKVDPIVSLRYE